MLFFRKSKNEDDGYEDEEEHSFAKASEGRRRRSKSGKFKDLIPQNKRARKELPKPWGRKERLLVLAVLLLTVTVSMILSFYSRGWKLPGLPRLKLPSFSFFKEETIVIEKDKERTRDRERAKEVVAEFKEKTKKASGVYALYVVNLDSGFSFGVYENEEFIPASLNKLPIMVGMYMESEKGNLSLETKYILKTSDKIAGSGSLYGKPAGYTLTYRDLVRYMGKESDNTAFDIAKNILGEEKIREVIRKIGMKDTEVLGEDQKTTPSDIGLLFNKLWAREIVSKKSADEILEFLTVTIYEDWLAAGVPKEVKVAHKFGREVHVVNDAGVVFGQRPYVVVILSKGVVEQEADEIFPTLSRIVYEGETF